MENGKTDRVIGTDLAKGFGQNNISASMETDTSTTAVKITDNGTSLVVRYTKTGNSYTISDNGEINPKVADKEDETKNVYPEELGITDEQIHEELFDYEIIDSSGVGSTITTENLPTKKAKITNIKPQYCNVGGIYSDKEQKYIYSDTNYEINFNGITDTLIIPYEVEINGEMYTITEVDLKVEKGFYNDGHIDAYGSANLPSIEKIIYPNTVTKIDATTEGNCENNKLKSIILSKKLNEIPSNIFSKCTSLINIEIPNNVTTIGENAFRDCTGLTSITIPKSVTTIENGVFSDCTGLTSITIPDSVTTIEDDAFYNCTGLTSITISDSVTTIGDFAFYDCRSLTSITIPNSVTIIGKNAFCDCTGLTSITIPDSVTTIKNYAFDECTGLTSITIPNSVTIIGDYAFGNCTRLTKIDVQEANNNYSSTDGILYNKDKTKLIGYPIGKESLSFSIPNSVTTIGDYAFDKCTGLTNITIPNSVTTIGNYAFYNCTGLTSITIPDSVTTIGNGAFYNCTGLTSITIPDSVTTIGNYAFEECTGLTSITIPDSVTTIEYAAFNGCTGLTSITIPNSVTNIGDGVFYNCTSLTSITIPDSVTTIGNVAFGHWTSSQTINCRASSKPSGWTGYWNKYDWYNSCKATVNWGYTGE